MAAAELAVEQHGVVARHQLLALGLPGRTISRTVARHGWRVVHPGVYALPGTRHSYEQRVMAALLASGSAAVASHLTAAFLHGLLPGPPPLVDLLMPASCRSRSLAGVHVTRSRTLRSKDVSQAHGVRCTTGPRTLIDLAGILEPPELRALVIDARQRRVAPIVRVLGRLGELGPVRGSGELRRILWELDAERCDSVLEQRARRMLRRSGLPAPAPAPVAVAALGRTLHVDIGWPAARVGLEVDGFAWHADRRALDRDQRRHNALTLAGWRVLRVGWDRIERDPEGLVAELRGLLTASVGA